MTLFTYIDHLTKVCLDKADERDNFFASSALRSRVNSALSFLRDEIMPKDKAKAKDFLHLISIYEIEVSHLHYSLHDCEDRLANTTRELFIRMHKTQVVSEELIAEYCNKTINQMVKIYREVIEENRKEIAEELAKAFSRQAVYCLGNNIDYFTHTIHKHPREVEDELQRIIASSCRDAFMKLQNPMSHKEVISTIDYLCAELSRHEKVKPILEI